MNYIVRKNERGFSPVIIIVIVIVVGLIGALGYVGYNQFIVGKPNAAEAAITKAITEAAAKCDLDDKDICKFYGSWQQTKDYSVKSTDTTDGVTNTTLFESANNGQRTHMKSDGSSSYEIITIDKITYTKSGDTWWKQAPQPVATAPTSPQTPDYKFEEPKKEDTATPEVKTTYKKIGKVACGNLQCFKYQVVNPTQTDPTEFIFFDDKDYLIRKMLTESAGSTNEQVFEYGNITINVPSPVKELGTNQYIVPGQAEPATIPTAPTPADM